MGRDERRRVAEESGLTERAVSGDGAAFATLYARHERQVYNFCYRIVGSADDAADATQEAFLSMFGRLPGLVDRELNFRSYLFTCARNASYDLVKRRGAARPTDEIPEAAAPVGPGAGGDGDSDPGAPEDDPERNVLLEAQQEEIRAANARLPERQREVLALRELEGLSYDEIAEIMGMNRNSVAQLISRARIGLRDALRSTALESVAGETPDCERALPLIALGEDRQQRDRADARWLKAHLAACDSCRLSREAMAEAGLSYRAWAPIAAAPWLFDDTVAKAAELVGADWSDVAEPRGPAEETAGAPTQNGLAARMRRLLLRRAPARSGRRRIRLVAALAALLVVIVFAGTTHDRTPGSDEATTGAPAEEVGASTAADRARRVVRGTASKRQSADGLPALGLPPRASGRKTARPAAKDAPGTTSDPPAATEETPEGTTDQPVVPPVPPEPPPPEPPRGIPPVFVVRPPPPPPPPRRCGVPGTPRCPRVP